MNLSRGLNLPKTGFNWKKSWKIEYNFKWNQPYLSRGSNSSNSASELWSHNTDVIIILSIISIKNEKLLNSNYNRSKPKLLRLLCDIVVFRLVAYLLNMICLNLWISYKIYIYSDFFYKFLETGTSDRTRKGFNS